MKEFKGDGIKSQNRQTRILTIALVSFLVFTLISNISHFHRLFLYLLNSVEFEHTLPRLVVLRMNDLRIGKLLSFAS